MGGAGAISVHILEGEEVGEGFPEQVVDTASADDGARHSWFASGAGLACRRPWSVSRLYVAWLNLGTLAGEQRRYCIGGRWRRIVAQCLRW